MRNHRWFGIVVIAGLLTGLTAAAQTPAEIAARQEMEDNVRRMNARMDDLFSAIESMQKRFSAMQDEVRKLSQEVDRAIDRSKDSAGQDRLSQLAKAIEKVDKERIADREKLVAAFADLEKTILNAATPKKDPGGTPKVTKPKTAPKTGSAPSNNEKGYEYTIQEGDYLVRIVGLLNKQGVKITSKQLADANPEVKDWTKLQIGQKIFIPSP